MTLVLAGLAIQGEPMRTRFQCFLSVLVLMSMAAAAEPVANQSAVKAPPPVEAKRDVAQPAPPAFAPAGLTSTAANSKPETAPAAPPPGPAAADDPPPADATPAATATPAPTPDPKSTAAGAKDAAKGANGKKDAKKEKKPKVLAKTLFGKMTSSASLASRAVGWYSKGCLSGGVHLADNGPNWQTMRLSRNRAWAHPKLIKLVQRLASDAKAKDGWPGLLIGDMSQPRGGPMTSGHASHQVGLDADIWLTPMPDRTLTAKEREDILATSMLDKTSLKVDPNIWTGKHLALIKRAATYPEVERIFVHPAIKKALCEGAGKDRAWLAKVRPLWGHNYHFHIRIGCPNGGCTPQPAVHGDEGCGKELTDWLKNIEKSLQPADKPTKEPTAGASDLRQVTLEQLPPECKVVLNSKGNELSTAERIGLPAAADAKSTADAKPTADIKPTAEAASSTAAKQ
jgi:penicillin-insensitive murein endopeptidase